MNRKNNSLYFRWLCKKVERKSSRYKYTRLMEELNSRPFLWSVPNDDNRLEDGLKLRESFANSHPSFLPVPETEPCSVLEMLIGLSLRMEDILYDQKKGDRTKKWFWEMVSNLGLDQFHDDNFLVPYNNGAIDHILSYFINRKYDRAGHGSLFPCRRSGKNMARVEIWYQMMQYLDENYAD